jgi:hypothetical protein
VPAQVLVPSTQGRQSERQARAADAIFAERRQQEIAESGRMPAAMRNNMLPRDQIRQ